MTAPVQLVWLKRDLRTHDHVPLLEASQRGPVVVLWVWEPGLWARPEMDRCHATFLEESLVDLHASLEALGIGVTVRTGRMVEVLTELHEQLVEHGGLGTLWSHQETGLGWTYGRDKAVAAWCAEHGIPWHEAWQDGVVRRLRDRDDWGKHRKERLRSPPAQPPARIAGPARWRFGGLHCPLALRPTTADSERVQRGGESLGLELVKTFLRKRSHGYRFHLSSPLTGEDGCSRLSPHLAWGTVSPRALAHRLDRAIAQRRRDRSDHRKDLEAFRGRLAWRDHFIQRLESQPSSEFYALQQEVDALRPRGSHPERFQAWTEGRTGFPMVDAVMRQLHQQKWTTFRMRCLVASVATYTLWLDWRDCAVWMAQHFLDFEPGIHFSQFQMQSGSTGINELRIYDPFKQGRDHDPDGIFLRRWVPELRDVPDAFVHEPSRMTNEQQQQACCRIGEDYPAPIVDFAVANRKARRAIEAVRGGTNARSSARDTNRRHGSRSFRGRRRR